MSLTNFVEKYDLTDSLEDRFNRIIKGNDIDNYPDLKSDLGTLRMYMSVQLASTVAFEALRRNIDLKDDLQYLGLINTLSKEKGFGRASEQ